MSGTIRQVSGWLRIGVAFACALTALPMSTAAAEPAASESAGRTTTFRKIFVPAGDEASWPVGSQRYLAVEPEEFERLNRALNSPADGQQAPPVAQLTTATYAARLEGDSLVGGKGSWTFTTATAPTLLEIGQCGLAVADVRWANAKPATTAQPDQPQPSGSADRSFAYL